MSTFVLVIWFIGSGSTNTDTGAAAVTISGYRSLEACKEAAGAVAHPRSRTFCVPAPGLWDGK